MRQGAGTTHLRINFQTEFHRLCHGGGGGVKMPSFFGYMLWSGAVLLPVFALLTFLYVS